MSEPQWLHHPQDLGVGYPLYTLPLPALSGALHVGPVPGRLRDGLAALHLDLIRAAGVGRIWCLVPGYDLSNQLLMPSYEPAARARFGERFHLLPVRDFDTPSDERAFDDAVEAVWAALAAGERVLVHCAAGCGRTGLFGACLGTRAGLDPDRAIEWYESHRGCGPETASQRTWVAMYATRQRR